MMLETLSYACQNCRNVLVFSPFKEYNRSDYGMLIHACIVMCGEMNYYSIVSARFNESMLLCSGGYF